MLGHQGNDVRLGNSLAEADGERPVGVGLVVEFRRDEEFSRHAAHDVQDGGVGYVSCGHVVMNHGGSFGDESIFFVKSYHVYNHCLYGVDLQILFADLIGC